MDIKIENKLKEMVRPLLEKGRPGDFEHTMRVLDIGRYLLEHENGDEAIVIPAIYLHDIGYSKVDFNDFLKEMPGVPGQRHVKKEKNSPGSPSQTLQIRDLHMKFGSTIAREILRNLDYPNDLTDRIVSIIAVHDNHEKLFALEDDSALILYEADHLDRLHPEGNHRLRSFREIASIPLKLDTMKKRLKDAALNRWLKTETARKLAKKWLEELH